MSAVNIINSLLIRAQKREGRDYEYLYICCEYWSHLSTSKKVPRRVEKTSDLFLQQQFSESPEFMPVPEWKPVGIPHRPYVYAGSPEWSPSPRNSRQARSLPTSAQLTEEVHLNYAAWRITTLSAAHTKSEQFFLQSRSNIAYHVQNANLVLPASLVPGITFEHEIIRLRKDDENLLWFLLGHLSYFFYFYPVTAASELR